MCYECEFPYQLINNSCKSLGIIEFSSIFYSEYEDKEYINVTLIRNYDTTNKVSIFYKLVPTYKNNINYSKYTETIYDSYDYNIISNKDITSNCIYNIDPNINYTNNLNNIFDLSENYVTFEIGETYKQIKVYIYPDMKVTLYKKLIKIELLYTLGGASLGDIKEAYIEVFDNISYPNIEKSYMDIQNKRYYSQNLLFL